MFTSLGFRVQNTARVFFFVVAPFCSCPASLVSRNFFAVGHGCAKCFFFCCAPLGAATFRRGQSQKKKNTTQGVFFLLRPRGKFFFFALAPCRRPTELLLPLPFPGAGAKKKHPGCCLFFCSGPVPARGFSFPCLSPGPEQKKTHPGWCFFFFAAAPRGRSLTHCGPGWRCLPLAGVVFFFFAAAPPGPGWIFLLWPRPDARSLTVGWGDFGKSPVVFFFLLRPRRVFLDNNKKCLGYYIGSKKTRRGHSKKKKNTTSQNDSCMKLFI